MAAAPFAHAQPKPFFRTLIGKKYLMGLSGLIWAGFILGHMLGNLLMFVSADAYNSYGHAITSGFFIYVIEGGLIGALLLHVAMAISLTLENRKAKGGTRYAVASTGTKKARFASRTMGAQGSVILAFIILHIATFKYGTHYETTVNGEVIRDLHRLLVEVFHQPLYVVWYIVALILLGFHLSHGFGSVFQSFGIKNQATEKPIRMASIAYAVIVAGGFLTQPLYIMFFA